jgi:addiction module HigA family antidote
LTLLALLPFTPAVSVNLVLHQTDNTCVSLAPSEDFMKPLELSISALARALHEPPNHVSGIVNQKRGISALMSLRLARYFGTSPELWLGLQLDYELDLARDTAADRIKERSASAGQLAETSYF